MKSNTVRFIELLDWIKSRLDTVNNSLKFDKSKELYSERRELLTKRQRVLKNIEYELNN
jgi:hypothetical protein